MRRRTVLQFPGFEPLDAAAHHRRYGRAAEQSARVWDLGLTVGPLLPAGGQDAGTLAVAAFDVACRSANCATDSRIHIFDHDALVRHFNGRSLTARLLGGFRSGGRVVLQGGMTAYFRHAWRFGLFFVFPFLFTALALMLALLFAALPLLAGFSPWTLLASLPAALILFALLFPRLSARLHVLHLLADWQLAVAVAALDDATVRLWIEERVAAARQALQQESDEVVISAHSMGASLAAHVLGTLIEREPALLDGRRVVFVGLGGALLQCALLKSATRLRAHVGRIAAAPGVTWFEVQCLTDAIHFYRAPLVALCGHPGLAQPRLVFIRLRQMLEATRYRRIRLNFLRVHRQYVLAADRPAPFDFTLMTAGPLPAADFARFSQSRLPQLGC
ncbi:hypothetical protein BTR14_06895 [Rhizobium rhizosphaerae]|uniref:Transmembrane protein n=1 Tax=Xaviernesmea rhizosphaerae TaxID=1672749 RepID=A0ABX3PFS3_9HYPH|nr:hypothetical protein [Xaviernesmea rhizosphaerae]OQP87268.1 hypothetical protein BTR14_06895 [Xaviernesmea rhizosphaerae]